MKPSRIALAIAAALTAAGFAEDARAQGQVDTSVGQVDNRVGGELYGNSAGMGTLILPQVRLLPSEERYAIWRSGALPSEVDANRNALGPLTPNGVIDYLPRQSNVQRAMGLQSPRLYNPAYDPAVTNGQIRNGALYNGVPRGYPQTAQQALAATNRRVGQNNQRPQQQAVDRQQQQQHQQQHQQQQQLNERQQRGEQPKPAVRPPTEPIPGLTPAPEQPLPTGQLFDDVRYDPNATQGAKFLNRQLPKLLPPPTPPLNPSLAEEKKKD